MMTRHGTLGAGPPRWAWALGAAALVGACARNPVPSRPSNSLLEQVAAARHAVSAAEWRYHPDEPAAMLARYPLGAHQALLVGERGERWLVDTSEQRATTSAWLAPEALVGVDLVERRRWLFVGTSGTVYESESTLGRFVRSQAAPEPLVRVSSVAGAILGVRRDGGLLVSRDGGDRWGPTGPSGVRFADAAVDERGGFVALAVPEALWCNEGNGTDWQRADAEPFGATSLVRTVSAKIAVRGALVQVLAPALRGADVRCAHEPELPSFAPISRDTSAISAGTSSEK